jgi:DNA-binding GntR family transcriptional regulator
VLERLEPIDREQGAGRTLREQLVLVLRKAILEANLPPGERLVETSLSEQLGVSRGPLREAILQLVEEGLVDQVPFRGAVVRSLSVEDIKEIYSFRTLLESFAFKVVWDKRTPEFFRQLDSRHRALAYAIYSGDQQQAITREMDLHGLVYESSKHRSLIESWNLLRSRLHFYFTLHHAAHHRTAALPDAHDSYVARAKGDDLDAMIDEVEQHMRRGLDTLEAFVIERNVKLLGRVGKE